MNKKFLKVSVLIILMIIGLSGCKRSLEQTLVAGSGKWVMESGNAEKDVIFHKNGEFEAVDEDGLAHFEVKGTTIIVKDVNTGQGFELQECKKQGKNIDAVLTLGSTYSSAAVYDSSWDNLAARTKVVLKKK